MADKLREYERKRDRAQTPEPFGAKGRGSRDPVFVVQRHDARNLHYDFRLERDGALASWAVPKGVPLEPGVRVLAVHVEDHPLDYASFEGEIPKGNYGAGSVEIWDRGTYELVEEKRDGGLTVRLHGERLEGTWTLVPAKLGGEERNWLLLRKPDAARRRAARPAPRVRADARHARRDASARRRLGLRGEVGRLPRARLRPRRRGEARLPQPQRSHRPLPRGGEGAGEGGAQPRVRRRRRGLRARRAGPAELLGDAAGKAGDAARLRGLRPAGAGRRAGRRPDADGAAGAAGGAARREQPHGQAVGGVRRRRGAEDRRRGAEPRGRDGQARRLAVRRGTAQPGLAEDQDAPGAGVRRLRLDDGTGPPRRPVRLARARRVPRRRAALGRQLRHRLHRPGHRRAAEAARAAAPRDVAARRRPQDGEGAGERRRVGRAEARLRGRVRGVDARRPPARAVVQGAARRQGCTGGATGDAVRRNRRHRRPRTEAVQPGQALLAGRGDHEGRPARVLRGGGAGDPAAPARPAVHHAPLSRRRVRQGVLPEGRAVAHAGLDPALPRRGVDARGAAEEVDRGAAGERGGGAAVDGEHGLHRHERVVLARRPAASSGLRPVRPRSVRRRRLRRDGRGGADRQGRGRRARARGLSEDERRRRDARARARSSGGTRTRTRGSSRRSSPARSRARTRGWRRPCGRRRSGAAC